MRLFLSAALLTLTACGGSTGPGGFSAQYTLDAVQPSPGVPVTGNGGKNVLSGCMDATSDGRLVQSLVYSVAATGVISKETTTWSYHLESDEIVVADPQNLFMGTTTIGSTTDSQISTYRVLANDGMPVTRTLVFTKLTAGPTCGSVN